jgi:hypothetical protein
MKVPGDFGVESVRNSASESDFSTNVVARDKKGSCNVNAAFVDEGTLEAAVCDCAAFVLFFGESN